MGPHGWPELCGGSLLREVAEERGGQRAEGARESAIGRCQGGGNSDNRARREPESGLAHFSCKAARRRRSREAGYVSVCHVCRAHRGVSRFRALAAIGAAPAQIRPRVYRLFGLGSGFRQVRRTAIYLWNAGHLRLGAVSGGSAGIGSAIFLAELAPPRVSDTLQFLIELLAAVPSVIYGMLGIFILVPLMRQYIAPALKATLGFLPLFQGPAYGVGLLTAGIVLATMIVPYIISVSREILLSVPRDQREAALALGATRWESTWKVVVPYARAGILGSVFLALARALGETMAVTMVIGSTPVISSSLLSPGDSIASVIASQFTEATGDLYLQSLVELGLVLFLLTFILNGFARLLIVLTSQRGSGLENA